MSVSWCYKRCCSLTAEHACAHAHSNPFFCTQRRYKHHPPTPRIDEFAKTALLFKRAYVQYSFCCPRCAQCECVAFLGQHNCSPPTMRLHLLSHHMLHRTARIPNLCVISRCDSHNRLTALRWDTAAVTRSCRGAAQARRRYGIFWITSESPALERHGCLCQAGSRTTGTLCMGECAA